MKIDIRVYEARRKYGRLPVYEEDTSKRSVLYKDVPISIVSESELDAAIRLEDLDIIRQNRMTLLILTDRKRVFSILPEGYSYARYACVIDVETARAILNRV